MPNVSPGSEARDAVDLDRQRIETIPHCDTCGEVSEFMPPEQGICGGCHNRPTLPSDVIVDGSDIEETRLLSISVTAEMDVNKRYSQRVEGYKRIYTHGVKVIVEDRIGG
ncbi:hypothetical protein SISNIDRAFT_486697 [Sistotremastrum niveocremeum HHB9708]|uniref:Uncharacterized protein n=1 Tax=Sistotremastrum niveocremeum HHB9708 TaxID=1314777 RepID=A0A164T8U3_9AGAM|nr:hypothetical protein SISNIDRAFT_486697 [Sistotremastrum niveocremeum HHB9708]